MCCHVCQISCSGLLWTSTVELFWTLYAAAPTVVMLKTHCYLVKAQTANIKATCDRLIHLSIKQRQFKKYRPLNKTMNSSLWNFMGWGGCVLHNEVICSLHTRHHYHVLISHISTRMWSIHRGKWTEWSRISAWRAISFIWEWTVCWWTCRNYGWCWNSFRISLYETQMTVVL